MRASEALVQAVSASTGKRCIFRTGVDLVQRLGDKLRNGQGGVHSASEVIGASVDRESPWFFAGSAEHLYMPAMVWRKCKRFPFQSGERFQVRLGPYAVETW